MPHVEQIPTTLSEGTGIIVQGHVSANATRFNINLSKERDITHSVPFHFDVRFAQNEVVRNHHHNSWGSEEKHGGNPFKKGEKYEVKIVVKHDAYQVFVNKQHFCDFKHRVGKEEARFVVVDGDFTVKKVTFQDARHHNPSVPLTVPVRLHEGRKISLSGVPTGGSRFSLYLLCGPSIDYDVAFTMDVRFNFGGRSNVVVRNHKSGGSWGAEEDQASSFPFSPNAPFKITIKLKNNAYQVSVNGAKFITFNNRIGFDRVTHFSVQGDVKLTKVKV